MKITKRNLILLILALVVFIGTGYWVFSMYKVNKTIDQLKSDDWQVRQKAMQILSKPIKFSIGSLISALKDEDPDIRWRAAYSLGKIGDSQAVEPLVETLKDKDNRVRYRAIEALGRIGDKRAVEPLNASLEDENLYVQLKVIWALKTIAREDFGEWQRQKFFEQNQWLMKKLLEQQFESEFERRKQELFTHPELWEQNEEVKQEMLERLKQKMLEQKQKMLEQQKLFEQNKDRYSTQNENK